MSQSPVFFMIKKRVPYNERCAEGTLYQDLFDIFYIDIIPNFQKTYFTYVNNYLVF